MTKSAAKFPFIVATPVPNETTARVRSRHADRSNAVRGLKGRFGSVYQVADDSAPIYVGDVVSTYEDENGRRFAKFLRAKNVL